jgi:cytochrome c peroxidase
MQAQGVRNTQSLRYLATNTAFHFNKEGTPTGGFFWDGRASSLADQAGKPFTNAREMANADTAAVIAKLAQAPYAEQFRAVYGANIFNDVDAAFLRLTLALQAFEREDITFNAYTSKYDAFLRGQTKLSATELHGLALFNDPNKGNCAACHPSRKGSDGSLPLFTDFSYDNLGLPRNWDLQVNQDPKHFDRGLCDSAAVADLAQWQRAPLCGAFKVPSLRNVAKRQALFHNGIFRGPDALKNALTFYAQRDTNPEKWYLAADGTVDRNTEGLVNKFNDLEPQYLANVNTQEAPYNRQLGDAPALSDSEIDDVIAFLNTLSDGWTP